MRHNDRQITKHHILCKSRGGTNHPENIALVKQGLHRKFHTLFGNKTPNEILEFLEKYFWAGNKNHINLYRKSKDGFFDD